MRNKSQFTGPIPTPEQLFQARIGELDSTVEAERSIMRRFVKKDGSWKVLYFEDNGLEVQDVQDDPITGMLTLAESVAKNLEIDLETFWQMTLRDPAFNNLHARMEDPVLLLKIKATLEEIFSVPTEERVYASQYKEIIDRFMETRNSNRPTESDAVVSVDVARHPTRRKYRTQILGALLVTSVFVPVACSAMDDGSSETLPALATETTLDISTPTTTVLSPQTTLATVLEQPATSAPVAVTIAELPTTVAPPETAPPETAPPRPNDGVLSPEACAAVGGTGVRFYANSPRLWEYLRTRFGLSDGQVNYLWLHTEMPEIYHIRDIYASNDVERYYECIPVDYHIRLLLESYSGQ